MRARSAARAGRAQQVAWLAAGVLALLYPIPFERSGQIYYETVGFLVLLNAMLGIGWNIIGGWAGQFDFGPSIFFAIGAYTAALLSIHLGWNAWFALIGAVVVSVALCAAYNFIADAWDRLIGLPACDVSSTRNTRFSTFRRATSIFASFNWMSW